MMNRREFCKLGVVSAVSGVGLLGVGRPAAGGEARPASDLDADRMVRRAMEVFLPEKKTCGEAMIAAGCEALGIRSDLVPDIALGLGGGVGLQGDVCGTISGSAMVISLAVARKSKDYATKKKTSLKHAGAVYNAFKEKFGCVECRKLCGLDLTTPEGRAELERRVKKDKCGKLVAAAARMLAENLQQIEKMA